MECGYLMEIPQPLFPSTRAVIDLDAFRNNMDVVRSYTGPRVKLMAVVKANAYGHGASRISSEAVQHGAEFLGVARIHEGIELRNEGIAQRTLVFEVPLQEQVEAAIDYDLELTVVSVDAARWLDQIGAKMGRDVKVHVKIDTGMGRLGIHYRQAPAAIETIARLQWIRLEGLYSHFATSEDPVQIFAKKQLRRFHEVVDRLHGMKVDIPLRHMANSGAIIALPDSHLDMVRPGIMLYGYSPRNGMDQKYSLKPVMSIVSRVAFVKIVEQGTSISYGRKYHTKAQTEIATVPIGYADGYSRLLTGKTEALIGGKRFPVVGTVCMDAIMLDVGNGSGVCVGDEVTLIGRSGGESITAWDIAEKLGTIPYEVTCLITPRVPRVFFP
jgi:alanine racemase